MQILTQDQNEQYLQLKNTLTELRAVLTSFGIQDKDAHALEQSILQLDDLFLLVVVGEFNAGKSAFINALLGERLLKEGVTPTTDIINIIRFSEAQSEVRLEKDCLLLTYPAQFLRDISIVDTPGTNAVIREHEAITNRFIPRADMVLFITSADRPFTESERSFLEQVRDWGKKLVVVINKIDLFENDQELDQVLNFVIENAVQLIGSPVEVFPVSAKEAFRAKNGEPKRWEPSRFGLLEDHIKNTLDQEERLRLKFANPIGISSHLCQNYQKTIQDERKTLKDDVLMLDDVNRQLAVYSEDMRRDFKFRMSDIENILYEMEKRGNTFFDETMRLLNIRDLSKKDRIQHQFEERVITDVPQAIEKKVSELIDWLVDSDFQQWQAVTNHIAERRRQYQNRIVGDSDHQFRYNREQLMEELGRKTTRMVDAYDHKEQARSIADHANEAVAATAALEVGAVGIGTLIAILGSAAAVDVTGIVLGSAIAILGLFMIPNRKRKAKQEMTERIHALKQQLSESIRKQFDLEMERSISTIQAAIAPYSQFVRAEQTKLEETAAALSQIENTLVDIQSKLEIKE